jgi:hypothetical protein
MIEVVRDKQHLARGVQRHSTGLIELCRGADTVVSETGGAAASHHPPGEAATE